MSSSHFIFIPFTARRVHKEPGGVTLPLSSNCTVKQRRHCSGYEQGIKTLLCDKESRETLKRFLMTAIKGVLAEGHCVYKGLMGN